MSANWVSGVLVGTQLLFTTGDLMARYFIKKGGFQLSNFFSLWFLVYFTIRTTAMFGQLFVFSQQNLGKSMAMFGAVSIILSNLMAYLLLNETLSTASYLGMTCAVMAFVLLAFR